MLNAYSPYSKFCVGAALRTLDGKIFTGANVENAAYGSTICAERMALGNANANGHRMFTMIAIIAKGENFDTTSITAPCGSCRQMLYEASQVSKRNLEIIMSTTKKDNIGISSIGELLPNAFGPDDLGIDVEKYRK